MLRIGHSYDIHRLEEDRELILAGVKIDAPFGTVAHSDGDVLVHVVIESIIGALGLGDIGALFPDTDPKYKDISSMLLLEEVVKIMKSHNFRVNNIDCSIYLETPKLRTYIESMRLNLAQVLEVEVNQINIKATRGERLGFIGRSEGIASEAVVLLTND